MKTDWYNLTDWSPRELQAIGLFAERPLKNLRRIQDSINAQIKIAAEKQYDDVLWRLQRLDLIVSAAIDKKCF